MSKLDEEKSTTSQWYLASSRGFRTVRYFGVFCRDETRPKRVHRHKDSARPTYNVKSTGGLCSRRWVGGVDDHCGALKA